MMTYTDDKINFGAYTYGLERIEVEAIDNTRPDSQDPLYYLYDGLGSVAYMVKPDGNMRDHYRYDEFGKPAPGNSKQSPDGDINLNNTFGYTGEMWEEESGLLYLRARYYEPETGRFLSRDTYAGNAIDPLSLNRYVYVQNNPLNYIDPTGYVTISVDGKLKIGSDKAWMTRNISDKRVYAPLQDLAKAVKASYKPNGSNKALVTYNGMPREFTFNQYNPDKDWWVRDFADKLGIEVEWNQAKQNVNLKTVKGKREDKKHFPDQGTGQSNWVDKTSNALTNNIAKPIAKALDPGKTVGGALKSTGKAVGGAFVAAGSMAVAAEAAVGDLAIAAVSKYGTKAVNVTSNVAKGIAFQAISDIGDKKEAKARDYIFSAGMSAITGYMYNPEPASFDINASAAINEISKTYPSLRYLPVP